ELKVKDKIVAIDGEPTIGLDVSEVIERIRGQEGTPVTLKIVREKPELETKDIVIKRGEVVCKEARIEKALHPFADWAIAHIKLHTFYEDEDTSSAKDIEQALQEMKEKANVRGVILDLRTNGGGLLVQAVQVVGLFIKKGIVVSIKDENGTVYNLRDLDSKKVWDGPLIVLVNRASASAAEVVSGTLQDYGRAIVIGDDHTYGKGTFQTFTLAATSTGSIDPKGEYKVTRGCYYTVSGKSPQLTGIKPDIINQSGLAALKIGEKFNKYPIPNDTIQPNFVDTLSDVPFLQKDAVRKLYLHNMQQKENRYSCFLSKLQSNSQLRLEQNIAYKKLLAQLNSQNQDDSEEPSFESFFDFQLEEAMNVM